MKEYSIKRHESGEFYLEILQGYGMSKHIYIKDLAHDVSVAKLKLAEIFKLFREEDLSFDARQKIIDSISEKIEIPKKSYAPTQPPKSNHHFIPQPGDIQPQTMTFKIPGAIEF